MPDLTQFPLAMEVETVTGKAMPKQKSVQVHVKDYWSGSATVTKTWANAMTSLMVANDGNADLTVGINGMTITVKATEVLDEHFDAFTSVTITSTVAFRAWARG